ncbi:MAG: TonB family protein, partial [Myxococcales bacterium]
KKKEPEPMPKGRVVDVAPGNNQKPDDDAKFLAESNNRVERETRSRDTTPFYKNAAPKPSTTARPSEDPAGSDAVAEKVLAGDEGKGQDDTPEKSGNRKSTFELPTVDKRDRLALKMDGIGGKYVNREESEAVQGNSDRVRIQLGDGGGEDEVASLGRAGQRTLKTLMPSAAVLDRITGAPAPDVLPTDDVDEGDGTYLNTREWKFSSFFNRIKQNVGMHWNPSSVVRRRDPTGEAYLYKDRYTLVSVTLDRRGLVKGVFIDKSSGVDFLDEEAIAAFHRAQPFPNPPPGLQNDRGEINFKFGFFLEVSSRGALRLFRYAN